MSVTLNVEGNAHLALRLQQTVIDAKAKRLTEYNDAHEQMVKTAKALLELAEAQTRKALNELKAEELNND